MPVLRPKNSHKGDFGRVLIIGGSVDYVGASYLAAMAALAVLRSGSDVATVAAPENVAWAINCLSPDIITKKVKGNYFVKNHTAEMLKFSEKFDVVLIGNGLGVRPETKQFVINFIKKIKKPLVIDADAIKAIRIQDAQNAIITPHKKEFEILLKNSRLTEKTFQKSLGTNILLLKGAEDRIISKTRFGTNKTGNPGMTVGGTGDILAGLCAGFVAQKYSLFDAAFRAAYINGKAGDSLFKKMGYGFLASDLLDTIPLVNRQI
jgi:hydroxyethylthiazole kinase-like uncharacterized protein yjeF